jgi:hypothetical protein
MEENSDQLMGQPLKKKKKSSWPAEGIAIFLFF